MKNKFLFLTGFLFVLAFFPACDMTTSDRVEGLWLSRASELNVMYEEMYILEKGGSYTYERSRDGKSVYKENGTWITDMQTVGNFEDEQRVIAFTPASPKGTKPYALLYALENHGKLLVLGTYHLDTDSVSKQRFYAKEEAEK